MANSVWNIQIRMLTTGNAPLALKRVGQAALQAGEDVKKLQSGVTSTLDKTIPEGAARAESSFKQLARQSVTTFEQMDQAASRSNQGYRVISASIDRDTSALKALTGQTERSTMAFRALGDSAARARTVSWASSARYGSPGGTGTSWANWSRYGSYPPGAGPRSPYGRAFSWRGGPWAPGFGGVYGPPSPPGGGRGGPGGGGGRSGGGGWGDWGFTGALALAGIGAGAGAELKYSVSEASNLQNQTLQAAVAMGRTGPNLAATTANMRDFKDVAFSMSRMTGQTIGDSMGVIASMSSAGVSPQQLKSIYKPIAQFTDILHFGKDKMDYGEASKLGAGIVHDMRLLSAKDTAYGLGSIAQLGYLSPHGLPQVISQVRRMAPTLENVLPGTTREKATSITEIAAWVDRMGNLPFAGSAISQMITQMIAPRSTRVKQAMIDLGIWQGHEATGKRGGKKLVMDRNLFFDQHTGSFDAIAALQKIALTYGQAKDKGPIVTALLQNTQNAMRIMQALSSSQSLEVLRRVKAQRGAMGQDPVAWMEKTQLQLMGELSTKTQLLTSNFGSLSAAIGNSIIPDLTDIVDKLQLMTAGAADFFMKHPAAGKAVAIGLGVTAGVGTLASLLIGGFVAAGVLEHLMPSAVRAFGGRFLVADLFGGMKKTTTAATAGRAGLFGLTGKGLQGLFGFGPQGIAGAFKGIGLALKSGGILEIVGAIFKLGLKAFSIVGWIMMAVDALAFLGKHSHDIGFLVGTITAKMPGLFQAAGRLGVKLMGDMLSEMVGVFNPMNWPKTLQSGVQGFWEAQHPGQTGTSPWLKPNAVPTEQGSVFSRAFDAIWKHSMSNAHVMGTSGVHGNAAGGYTTADGLAYLHKNEVIVGHRTTRELERMTAPGRSGAHGGNVIKIALNYAPPAGESDAQHRFRAKETMREMAEQVAEILERKLGLDLRSGGAIPAMADQSYWGLISGIPS